MREYDVTPSDVKETTNDQVKRHKRRLFMSRSSPSDFCLCFVGCISGVCFVLIHFSSSHGNAVLRDCGMSWVSSLTFLLQAKR